VRPAHLLRGGAAGHGTPRVHQGGTHEGCITVDLHIGRSIVYYIQHAVHATPRGRGCPFRRRAAASAVLALHRPCTHSRRWKMPPSATSTSPRPQLQRHHPQPSRRIGTDVLCGPHQAAARTHQAATVGV
jgi:hypothetical protein